VTPHEKFWKKYRKPREGRTLIVGSQIYGDREDRRGAYQDVVGVDMQAGPGVDIVANLEDLEDAAGLGTFDHVECRSVLEHSRRPWRLAENLEFIMRPGSTLDLSVPFMWKVHAYPSDYWRFTIEGVRELFPGIRWDALMYATQETLWDTKQPKVMMGSAVYFPRTEVLGFGVMP
jgi:hypothetical protein